MKSSTLRRIPFYAVSLGIAACGGDSSAPPLPTSVQEVLLSGVSEKVPSPEISMPVTSEGVKPAGFEAIFRVDPKPDKEGIIRGDSPLSVEFDVCDSRSGDDKPLTYLFDWDFDHRPNVVGTGDACHQEHTYDTRRFTAAKGNVLFETKVCAVSGNPRVHGPGTYFSCRNFRISLPAPVQPPPQQSGCTNNPQWMPVTCTTSRWVWSSNRAVATTLAAANAAKVLETGCSHVGTDQPALGQGLCSLDGTGFVSTQTFVMSGCDATWSHIGGSFTGDCGGHDGDTTRHLVLGVNDCFDY